MSMVRRLWVGGLGVAALVGCQGQLGGPDGGGAPPPPDAVPQAVPTDGPALAVTSSCQPLELGEALVSVSPEGHAWLVAGEGAATQVRIVDPLAPEAATVTTLDLPPVVQLSAWSGSDASIVAADGLWRLEDLARIELTPPEGFTAPAHLCGDPAAGGAIVSGGALFEHRADAWYGYFPGVLDGSAPAGVVSFDGACTSRDDVIWLTGGDGTLWRVAPQAVTLPVRFEGFVAAVGTTDTVAVSEPDRLWIGPEAWQPWIFPEDAAPSPIAAAGGAVWAVADGVLYRYAEGDWASAPLDGEPSTLLAHAAGVWTVAGGELCHHALGAPIQIEGLRPFTRSVELEYPLTIAAVDTPTVELDGEPVDVTAGELEGTYGALVRLTTVGWHEVVVEASGLRRTLWVKRNPEEVRSWAVDIAPIYEGSCTGAACHVAGGNANGAPDLGSYELWVAQAEAIRNRVVDAKTMPPIANQGADWGDEQVAIVAQWLEGGQQP